MFASLRSIQAVISKSRPLFCSVFFAVSSGCSSYTPKPLPTVEFSSIPVQYTEGDIQLGAEVYVQLDRQTAVFDAELSKCSVLPVRVLVRNLGQRAVWVRSTDVELDLPDGPQLTPIDVFTVGRCGETLARGEPPTPIIAPPAPLWGLGPQVGAVSGLIGATIGLGSLAVAEASVNNPRIAHYQKIELRAAVLRQNESTHGFVFFYVPPDNQLSDTAVMNVRLHDAEDDSSFSVRLPLSGLRFETQSPGSKPEKTGNSGRKP